MINPAIPGCSCMVMLSVAIVLLIFSSKNSDKSKKGGFIAGGVIALVLMCASLAATIHYIGEAHKYG